MRIVTLMFVFDVRWHLCQCALHNGLTTVTKVTKELWSIGASSMGTFTATYHTAQHIPLVYTAFDHMIASVGTFDCAATFTCAPAHIQTCAYAFAYAFAFTFYGGAVVGPKQQVWIRVRPLRCRFPCGVTVWHKYTAFAQHVLVLVRRPMTFAAFGQVARKESRLCHASAMEHHITAARRHSHQRLRFFDILDANHAWYVVLDRINQMIGHVLMTIAVEAAQKCW